MKLNLVPKNKKWRDFGQSNELFDYLWAFLKLKEHGGKWKYLKPTLGCSIWELDGASVYIFLDEKNLIAEFVINRDFESESEIEIQQLLKTLEQEFHLMGLKYK